MLFTQKTYRHPTQASSVALSIFEEKDGRYLVTESRSGPQTVVATLGAYDRREDAVERVRDRAQELTGQRYALVAG
jgi:hypothetical protein